MVLKKVKKDNSRRDAQKKNGDTKQMCMPFFILSGSLFLGREVFSPDEPENDEYE